MATSNSNSNDTGNSPQREENISVRTHEDQATINDLLGFEPYVKAIASFLTSKDTKPPLVLSVEGEWGSGKTSFMLQLEKELKAKGDQITIWFNPWRHDKEDAVWAAFALTFFRQLTQELSFGRRILGHIRRFFRRFNWKEGWLDFAIKITTWIGLFVLVCLLGWNAYYLGDHWIENVYKFISDGKTDLYKTAIENGIKTGGVAGFLVLVTYILGKLMPIIEDPLKKDLQKYIISQKYEDRISFVERFHNDFKEVLDIYANKQTIYVFIDDLDRCEVPKAAELMSALNLMITNDPRLVFIIGMDREKVAAGLAVKHEKLLPYFLASHMYNRSKFSNKEFVGLEFGYEFIEKFVQLPFRIPQPDTNQIDNFLAELSQDIIKEISKGSQFQIKLRSISNRLTLLTNTFRKLPAFSARRKNNNNEQNVTNQSDVTDVNSESRDVSGENKRRESLIVQIGPESPIFISIIKTIAPTFNYNPRKLKQFVNLFRLKVYIAAETGLFDEDIDNNTYPLTLEQIAKFTALDLRWPLLLSDIEGDINALRDLQELALGIPSETISPRAAMWQERQDLINFMKIGHLISDANNMKLLGMWDLSSVNLLKLLKVSPKIRDLSIFSPRDIETGPTLISDSPSSDEVFPSLFVGRFDVIENIRGHIDAVPSGRPLSISLIGPHGVGKTSILLFVEREIISKNNNFRSVHINADRFASDKSSAILGFILKNLNIALPKKITPNTFFETLEKFHKDTSIWPIICVDEFDAIGEISNEFGDSFYSTWRSLSEMNYVGFITASSIPLNEIMPTGGPSSPFWNIFTTYILDALTLEESRVLMEKSGLKLTQNEANQAANIAKGNPRTIKYLANLMAFEKQKGNQLDWDKIEKQISAYQQDYRNDIK